MSNKLWARLFSSEASADLLAPVESIDVNKFAERSGVKRFAVRDFGDNNLVLLDEGHLGASSKVWRRLRAELAEGGFTFEYSATFNQIASRNDALRDAYGKSLLFDYRRSHTSATNVNHSPYERGATSQAPLLTGLSFGQFLRLARFPCHP